MQTTKILSSITIAAISVAAFAGCVQAPEVDAAPKPTETVEPVVEIDPADTDGNGSVSEHEKRVAAMFAVRDYTLSDGTKVSVDPAQPLPDAVRADIAQAVGPSITIASDSGNGAELRAVLAAKSDLTGRIIIVVYEGQPGQWGAVASNNTEGLFNAVNTRDEAVELATAYGQKQRNFDIITP